MDLGIRPRTGNGQGHPPGTGAGLDQRVARRRSLERHAAAAVQLEAGEPRATRAWQERDAAGKVPDDG